MSHEVHNMMEELVEAETEKLFDSPDIRNEPWFSCGCPQCRGDVICYVLNRLQPKYIRSGRGISHHTNNGRAGKFQTDADITALGLEGIQKVSIRKRPHSHGTEEDARDTDTAAPVFYFPAITGRVLNGLSFEPEAEIPVGLYLDGKLCTPLSAAWENPCYTNARTAGHFAFSVQPLPASAAGERRVFEFEIRIQAEGKEPLHHFLKVGAVGGNGAQDAYHAVHTIVLPDLFLFPAQDPFDAMQ